MTHPIFSLIFCNNLIEVITLIKNDPGVVRVRAPKENLSVTPLFVASLQGREDYITELQIRFVKVD